MLKTNSNLPIKIKSAVDAVNEAIALLFNAINESLPASGTEPPSDYSEEENQQTGTVR